MAVVFRNRIARLFFFILALLITAIDAQCNTDQNPYCAGNSALESLCCTYPSVCYWSNRNGDPACCPAGTDCRGDGGPALVVDNTPSAVSQVQATTYLVASTYYSTQPQTSTVTYYYSSWSTSSYSPPPQQFTSLSTVVTAGVVAITDASAVVVTAAPPVVTNGAFVTVTQVQYAAEAARYRGSSWDMSKAVGAAAFGILMLFIY